MQLKGSHSPSGLSLGLQIAAIGRRKARESGVCVGGVGDMGETGLVDRSTIRKALHKNQENKKRMKIKPLPCLEWSLPISPHQTAGIKHQIGCNPTKKKTKAWFRSPIRPKRARGYIRHRARARVELWSPSRAHSPSQPPPTTAPRVAKFTPLLILLIRESPWTPTMASKPQDGQSVSVDVTDKVCVHDTMIISVSVNCASLKSKTVGLLRKHWEAMLSPHRFKTRAQVGLCIVFIKFHLNIF